MLLRFISKDESNQLRNHTIRAKVFHKVQGSHMVFYKFKSHMLGCSYGLSRKQLHAHIQNCQKAFLDHSKPKCCLWPSSRTSRQKHGCSPYEAPQHLAAKTCHKNARKTNQIMVVSKNPYTSKLMPTFVKIRRLQKLSFCQNLLFSHIPQHIILQCYTITLKSFIFI